MGKYEKHWGSSSLPVLSFPMLLLLLSTDVQLQDRNTCFAVPVVHSARLRAGTPLGPTR